MSDIQQSTKPLVLVPPPEKRMRRWAPKVRTGCSVCRKRRIKCDEGRPSCKRCIVSGHLCEYPTHLPSPPDDGAAILLSFDPAVAPHIKSASARERRAFNDFRVAVAPSLANSNDEIFWSHDIMRAAHVSPAIWHVVLSITALRLKEPTADVTAGRTQLRNDSEIFSLTHYSKAIHQLVGIMDQPDIPFQDQEVLLIASLVCLEMSMLRGETREVFIHSYHAAQLFKSWRAWHTKRESFLRQKDCLLTWSTAITMMKALEASFLWNGAASRAPVDAERIAEGWKPFASVVAAFEELEPLMSAMYTLYQGGFLFQTYMEQPHTLPDGRVYYHEAISIWEQRYYKLKESRVMTVIEDMIDSVMEVWLFAMKLLLEVNPQRVEAGWGIHTESFKEVISRAEAVIEKESVQRSRLSGKLSEEIGQYVRLLTQTLYQAALLCRVHDVRRKAVATMRRLPGVGKDWMVKSSAALAERRMEAEEKRQLSKCDGMECTCADGEYICHGHRAVVYKIDFRGMENVNVLLWSKEGYLQKKPPYRAPVKW